LKGSLGVVWILLLLLEHSLLLHLGSHHAPLHWKPWGFASYACLSRYAWLRSCLGGYARLLRHHACLLGSSRACTNYLFHWSSSSFNNLLSLHL